MILPVTSNDPSVPTEVILGCAAVVSVPVNNEPETVPVTSNDVSVPTEVILGCAAVVSVPVINVPDMLPPEILPVAETVPAVLISPPVTVPVTFKLEPVALPMLGVIRFAPALTMMLPPPSKAVVSLSVFALNC